MAHKLKQIFTKQLLFGNGFGNLLQVWIFRLSRDTVRVLLYSFDIFPYTIDLIIHYIDYDNRYSYMHFKRNMQTSQFTQFNLHDIIGIKTIIKVTAKILPKV